MEAQSAAIFPGGGATLTGEVHTIPANTIEYGFLLATDSLFTSNQLFVKATTPLAVGVFKQDVNTGIVAGKTYYYTVYSRTSSYSYIRYNTKTFNSDGSKSVKVDSIYPLKAAIGDTITIKGRYFSNQGINVTMGGQFTGIIASSDTVIKFTVPATIDKINAPIILQYGAKPDTISTKFSLYAPMITGFTAQATFRDTITIAGDHFGYLNSLNQVSFGSVKATIVSSSRKQIKVIVPDGVTTVKNLLTVNAQLQTVTASTQFQITTPIISSVTASAHVNDVITITGKYFHPIAGDNFVYFENNGAQSVLGSTTQLQVNFPAGPYPRKKAKLTIKILDIVISYPVDITITDTWIMVANTFPFDVFTTVGAFTINNTSYVIASTSELSPRTYYLWKFNPANYSWQQINIPVNISYGALTATSTKMYLYTGAAGDNFWEYDPAANTWTEKAMYLAGTRVEPTMFVVGNKLFMGLGTVSSPDGYNTADYSFYQYDLTNDVWTNATTYPANINDGTRINSSVFVINNIAYIGGGASNHPADEFYSYNASNNAWAQLGNFNNPSSGQFTFSYNGYGFVAGGDSENFQNSTLRSCYKYNPNTDTWTMLPDNIGLAQLGGNGISPGFVLINNGNVYIADEHGGPQFSELFVATASKL